MLNRFKKIINDHPRIKKILRPVYRLTIARLITHKRNRTFLKNAELVLEKVNDVFNEIGISYWLDFGTLLGAVRDGDFIQHDVDLDVAMWLHDYSESLDDAFIRHGFRKRREISIDNGVYGFEQTYTFKGVSVDIFFYTKLDEKNAYYHDFLTNYNQGEVVIKARELLMPVNGIKFIDFKGRKYPVPTPTEEHLAARYGDTYLIKDSNWSIEKGNTSNVSILEDRRIDWVEF